MSHTEMDRETCEVEYGLEQTDLETCPKSVWSPERRERLVSPIGDRLRVTRARDIRKRLTQAERKRKSVTKKAHGERERETRASTRTNPVLSKGHPQDVAHPATVDPAESIAPRRSCIVWPLLAKRFVFSLSVQVRALRKESMC